MKLPVIRTRIYPAEADTGALGHISNGAFVNYMQVGRAEFLAEVTRLCDFSNSALVVNITLDLLSQCYPEDVIEVVTWCDLKGRKSIRICNEIFANGKLAAKGSATAVGYNPRTQKSEPLPDDWELSSYSGLSPENTQ